MSGLQAFLQGVVAGYGIAIPVGAIAVLIIEMGLRRGFAPAFWAGAGAATADGAYASVAALVGAAVASVIGPAAPTLEKVGGAVLIAIAIRGVMRSPPDRPRAAPASNARTYVGFLGLTMLNPTTVIYFSALIIGLQSEILATATAKAAFVTGAFLASLSWQTLLAASAGLGHRRLHPTIARAATWTGSLIVAALGLRLVL